MDSTVVMQLTFAVMSRCKYAGWRAEQDGNVKRGEAAF
jgi:hypothetical protein